jgi:acetylornithine/succinyldiaminopimelate/putrescine aminotransferase
MTLAKGLAGGLPIGTMLAREEIARSFSPGSHASTFGGNPVVAASALATINTIIDDGVLQNCIEVGNYLFQKLNELKEKYPFVKDLRGKGLIIGMELEVDGSNIVKECLKRGLLINCTMSKILRFLPPLIVTKGEVDTMVRILDNVFSAL